MLRPIMVQCVGFWISTGISRTVKRRYSATVCDGISKVALNRYCTKRTNVHRLPCVVRAATYRGALYRVLILYGYTVDHTYSLHGAVIREKLTGFQLVKKFPAFYGTRRFITALTNAHRLSLS